VYDYYKGKSCLDLYITIVYPENKVGVINVDLKYKEYFTNINYYICSFPELCGKLYNDNKKIKLGFYIQLLNIY
jgi:hypothetical protein